MVPRLYCGVTGTCEYGASYFSYIALPFINSVLNLFIYSFRIKVFKTAVRSENHILCVKMINNKDNRRAMQDRDEIKQYYKTRRYVLVTIRVILLVMYIFMPLLNIVVLLEIVSNSCIFMISDLYPLINSFKMRRFKKVVRKTLGS